MIDTPCISYDVETTGLDRYGSSQMFSYSTSDEFENVGVFRLDGSAVRQSQSRRNLEKIWGEEGKGIAKTMHNAKFDLTFTEKELGHSVEDHPFHDTMVMSHILRNDHYSHALKDLCWELAGIPKDDESALKPYTRGGQNWQYVPENLMTPYQKGDAIRGILLKMFFLPKIRANKQWSEIYDVELRLLRSTMRMEERGVVINPKKCQKLIEELQTDLVRIMRDIESICGRYVNPSGTDMRHVLIKEFNLPVLKRTPKTQEPCIGKEELAEYRLMRPDLPILSLISNYRSWVAGIAKLRTYLRFADANNVIHPNIKTNGASTGRQSCETPNLHNVDKERVLLNPFPIPARRVFQPRHGYVNFHLDYSGEEMRVLIHYSGEDSLVKIANTPGGDLHDLAATIFYGDRYTKEQDPVKKKELRDAAKNANFAMPYGAMDDKTAETLGIPISVAQIVCGQYRRTFPKLMALLPKYRRMILDQGFLTTAFGRRLYIPRSQAHAGINALIQGTCAEILKRATNKIDAYLRWATGDEMRILLTIHDEIIIECPRSMLKHAKEILRKVRELMVDFPGVFKVPLEVDCKIAVFDWAHKSKFSLED